MLRDIKRDSVHKTRVGRCKARAGRQKRALGDIKCALVYIKRAYGDKKCVMMYEARASVHKTRVERQKNARYEM